MAMKKWFIVLALLSGFLLSNCSQEARLSSIVVFHKSDPIIAEWLNEPKYYFTEAFVRFDEKLDESTLFGIDQELLEGVEKPIHIKGGDWMGLIGLQRSGKLWVAVGNDRTMSGEPSKDRTWEHLYCDKPLKPNSWYRLYSIVDYSNRHFVSFTIQGENINQTFDLKKYKLDYPNMLGFDKRAMTNFVWAIGSSTLGAKKNSYAKVYFDDVRGGVISPIAEGGWSETVVFSDGFEHRDTERFEDQPWTYMDIVRTLTIPLVKYRDGYWYLERGQALAKSKKVAFARSGDHVVMIDATIKDISYKNWFLNEQEYEN